MVTTQEPGERPGRDLVPVSTVVGQLVGGVPTKFVGMPDARRDELTKAFWKGVERRRLRFNPPAIGPDHGPDAADAAADEPIDAELVDPDADPEAGTELTDDVEPDPRDLISAQRAQIRRVALHAAIPDGRAKVALQGLSCLDPRDQHPADLRAWLDDPDKLTAVLAGPTGNGKTMAAYALAAEAALHGAMMRDRADRAERRRLVVRAWTVNGYLAELRPDGSPDPPWLIRNRARWAELLILDDLGAEVDTEAREFVRRELVELIEYRIEKRLRTVFTTNLTAPAVEQKFDGRFWSRLTDRATGFLFAGHDRRALSNLTW